MRKEPRVLPDDDLDRQLVEHVHPPHWTEPRGRDRYDLIAIGAGAAGLVSSAGLAGLGGKAALIERHLLGGDCLNVGCVPSKALLAAGRRAARRRAILEAEGVPVPPLDFGAVMRTVRERRLAIAPHDSAARFRELGVDVYFGHARFKGPRTLVVGERELRFKRAVIATGSRPRVPSIPGLNEIEPLTNETLFEQTERPERLIVLGAGPIGCEMAQAMRRLGCAVEVVSLDDRLLPREDPEASRVLERSFQRDGIRMRLGVEVTRAERDERGKTIHFLEEGRAASVTGDEVLVATGRTPNVEGLDLERASVAYDPRRGIQVDARLRTSNPRIFAAGDVVGSLAFTHAADAMARLVLQNAFFFGRARRDRLVVPWCTYTDPEVAHVGLTAEAARGRGTEVDTFTVHAGELDRAIVESKDEGFARIHVERGKDRIVGATFVGPNAGDLISEISLAMTHGIGLGALATTIHPYPTRSEAWKKLGDAYRRTKLTPFVSRVLEAIIRWRR